jgi:hypothetical protein
MASNNVPKCQAVACERYGGCEGNAALNPYYPNSEGGQFWALCEECFQTDIGAEYDELRVVEDFNNSGNTAEENEEEQAEMFAAMALWGTNWREHLPKMTQEEIVARRQRQEAIGAGLVAPGQVCEDDDEEELDVFEFEYKGKTYWAEQGEEQRVLGGDEEDPEVVGKWVGGWDGGFCPSKIQFNMSWLVKLAEEESSRLGGKAVWVGTDWM